ncbi:MAG: host attachment protein [Gammaproteobacteria bacterium]|nr:host attachment protein [Gammaproteobacteria bacterium]
MKWIMLANSNDCRIYEYDHRHKHLALIDEIAHPEHRLKLSSWTTDSPGKYRSGNNHGSYEPEVSPLEVSVDDFAREMARRLDEGRNKHAFEDVTLVMSSKMEGLLFKHMNKHTKALIERIVQKNMNFMSEHELSAYVEELFTKSRHLH